MHTFKYYFCDRNLKRPKRNEKMKISVLLSTLLWLMSNSVTPLVRYSAHKSGSIDAPRTWI